VFPRGNDSAAAIAPAPETMLCGSGALSIGRRLGTLGCMEPPTNLTSLFPSTRSRRAAPSLAHADHPLEQRVRSGDRGALHALMHASRIGERHDGVIVVGDGDGLRVLGRSESALEAFAASLVGRFGDRVVVDPPSVRIASGTPSLEPWMAVAVCAPGRHMPRVRSDFHRRCGRVERLRLGDPFVLDGEAPLAQLLGYARWVEASLPGAYASLSLSRYRPLADNGPGAA
jgi:hypothetical protein